MYVENNSVKTQNLGGGVTRYEGKCPYHKSYFEGLASGPAI